MIGWVGGRGGEAHKAEEEEDKEGEGGGGTGGDVGEIGRRRRARGVAEEREVSSGSRQPCFGFRPGHPSGRVGFGSGQKKPGVFSSGPCPTRPGGRAVKLSPHPTRQPVGSGRVRVGSGRAYVKCRVPSGFFGFRVKIFSPCPARQSYRVKNFDPSPPIKLFGSGRVGLFSGGLGRVRRVGQPMPRSTWKLVRRQWKHLGIRN